MIFSQTTDGSVALSALITIQKSRTYFTRFARTARRLLSELLGSVIMGLTSYLNDTGHRHYYARIARSVLIKPRTKLKVD